MATYMLRKYWSTISTFLPSIVDIGPNRKYLFNFLSFFANNKEGPGLKCTERHKRLFIEPRYYADLESLLFPFQYVIVIYSI